RLEDVIQTWGRPSLSVLPSGQVPPNPSELLGSQGMRSVLARLTRDYDIVIFDAPPLLPVTDAAALGAVCHGALLIVRHGKTRRAQVARAQELLTSAGGRLLGSVLNFAPAGHGVYGYGYGSEERPATEPVKAPANV